MILCSLRRHPDTVGLCIRNPKQRPEPAPQLLANCLRTLIINPREKICVHLEILAEHVVLTVPTMKCFCIFGEEMPECTSGKFLWGGEAILYLPKFPAKVKSLKIGYGRCQPLMFCKEDI